MKRKRTADVGDRQAKKPKDGLNQSTFATPSSIEHPVLRRLYPQLLTLRLYLLSRLPTSSKKRRRRISQLGLAKDGRNSGLTRDDDAALVRLLDSTLIGLSSKAANPNNDGAARARDIECFSQQLPDSTAGSDFNPGYFMQPETVDFVIWTLFKKYTSSYRPPHILCHGFQRASAKGQNGLVLSAAPGIPGILCHYPNSSVETVKGPLWCRVHSLMGQGGDRVMMDLLQHCGIFCPLEGEGGNYYQLSGFPVSELKPLPDSDAEAASAAASAAAGIPKARISPNVNVPSMELRKPTAIRFVRSRMLYARAALNAKGGIRFGMRHIHALNRFSNREDAQQTIHIMKYIFPRQFGLHNVFTSKVDPRDTALAFKDYTLREKEIQHALLLEVKKRNIPESRIEDLKTHVPKRLRGETVALVNKLRKLNQKCSYTELLRHYCPIKGLDLSAKPDWRKNPLQPSLTDNAARNFVQSNKAVTSSSTTRTVDQTCFTDLACSSAHVSAFCRAVVSNVVPNGFWGNEHNKHEVMHWIDRFIHIRRFESLTLHQVTQKLKIASVPWLKPPSQTPESKMAKTDFVKRQEIFMEFIYYIFDSFLIPLIRSNFHVTESNAHRNRLFYFRHDVWRMLSEPSLMSLKLSMFEEMPMDRASKLLSSRTIGYSKTRLLPKKTGVRLIMNLRRRQQSMKNGVMVLGRSINAAVAPVFNALNYEKSLKPEKLGCSIFSVGEMFPRLAAFRSSLRERGLSDSKLYFAKVDVQSCFDTIPQKRLVSVVESLLSIEEYEIGRHAEISPPSHLQCLDGRHVNPAPIKRFFPHGKAAGELSSFDQLLQSKYVGGKSNTIFVNSAVQRFETKHDVMHLLKEHVERNIVKIGKKFYRQKSGIPQGSVLSSLLCNFFYAELERYVLGFVLDEDSVLVRLLDDFLLITIRREHAQRFLRVMHCGQPEYGVVVKADKSLVNFDFVLDNGHRISKSPSDTTFPYCGILIDTVTLDVGKDMDRTGRGKLADTLTVDMAKVPGQTFHRKTLSAFKIQLHAMFLDTSFNSLPTVLTNLYHSFLESAVRCFEYIRNLSRVWQTSARLLIKTVDSLVVLASVMLQRHTRSRLHTTLHNHHYPHTHPYQTPNSNAATINKRQIQWLALRAFRVVFQRRQSQHAALLTWLRSSMVAAVPASRAELRMLKDATAGRA